MLYLQVLLNKLYQPHIASLVTNSKIASKLYPFLMKPAKFLTDVALATIRKLFCLVSLCSFCWCLGSHLASVSLIMGSLPTASHLTKVRRNGIYPRSPSGIKHTFKSLEKF